MKIQCSVCESAEAVVLCCADEAALCWSCDEKVHAANKLAGKHQRVPLSVSSSSSSIPKCDICQEASGFFFCLQDRALLCRKCDVAIHTVNPHVSAHQRFLLTGIKVGLESIDTGPSGKSSPANDDEPMETKPFVQSISEPQKTTFNDHHQQQQQGVLPESKVSDQISTKLPFASSGSATGSIPQWQIDEIFGLTDFDQSYEYMENNGSSKGDTCRRGDSDSSSMMRSAEEDAEADDNNCLGGERSWAVPQIQSPPTASGLNWHHHSVFVPEMSSSSLYTGSPPKQRVGKRRRRWF